MKKLYEIGDQPLPIKRVATKGHSVNYYFDVPLQAPEEDFTDHIPMKVMLMQHTVSMTDLYKKSDNFVKGDYFLPPLIEKNYEIWADILSELTNYYDSSALQMQAYEVLFGPISTYSYGGDDISSWKMQNFKDRSLPIKIISTVKSCVTDFLEKHDYDMIRFLSEKEDHGRCALYDRFSALIAKNIGFGVMKVDRGEEYVEFICIDSKKLKNIFIRLTKIKELLKERNSDFNPSTRHDTRRTINELIQKIANGTAEVFEEPKQYELDL